LRNSVEIQTDRSYGIYRRTETNVKAGQIRNFEAENEISYKRQARPEAEA
jgi:hypothetical protein